MASEVLNDQLKMSLKFIASKNTLTSQGYVGIFIIELNYFELFSKKLCN